MKKLISNSLIAILFFFSAVSQAGELPDSIEKGLESYKESGSTAAAETWIKGSPMEGGDFLSKLKKDGLI